MAGDDDTKVKDAVLDAATRAELERWFSLPSFQDLEAKGVEIDDVMWAEARKKRAQALAAVDPAMLEWHRVRNERENILFFKPNLELHVELHPIGANTSLADSRAAIAEPREVQIKLGIDEDLAECTPQALLRDLHRPEMFFEKVFEYIDFIAEQRVDAAAAIAEVMTTRWSDAFNTPRPYRETVPMLDAAHTIRRQPWPALFAENTLPNRRFEEDK